MFNKNTYVIQPHKVGSKDRKSTVVTIPAELVKQYEINANTIFILKPEDKRKLILHKISNIDNELDFENKTLIPVEKSLEGSDQQASSRDQ